MIALLTHSLFFLMFPRQRVDFPSRCQSTGGYSGLATHIFAMSQAQNDLPILVHRSCFCPEFRSLGPTIPNVDAYPPGILGNWTIPHV